jgi:hypothetical protein
MFWLYWDTLWATLLSAVWFMTIATEITDR